MAAKPPPAKKKRLENFPNLTRKFGLFLVAQGLWIFLFLALLSELTTTQSAQIEEYVKENIERPPEEIGSAVQRLLFEQDVALTQSRKISNLIEKEVQTIQVQ